MTPSAQSYREIQLTQGQVALVDLEDYDRINQWKWCAMWVESSYCFYAVRAAIRRDAPGKRFTQCMHREVMGLTCGDKSEVDHIKTLETLNNLRSNLRLASRTQNANNRPLQQNNTSGHKGINWYPPLQKWRVRTKIHGVEKHVGYFIEWIDAIGAQEKATLAGCGEFANFDSKPKRLTRQQIVDQRHLVLNLEDVALKQIYQTPEGENSSEPPIE
jgi:hypothetical protein